MSMCGDLNFKTLASFSGDWFHPYPVQYSIKR
jgi:hypothetical protein